MCQVTPPVNDPSARVAALFDRVADSYENVGVAWFAPIAQGLVSLVAPLPGERAVDLGCGRGAALFPLAEAVGPTGHVTGVDLSARMVALTAQQVADLGLTTVDVQVGDAARPQLEAGADVVVASLVLFFIPAPQQALTAWAGLLRPGGRLAISTFGGRDDAWRRLDDLFTPYLPPQLLDARTSGESGPFGSDAGVEAMFTAAGLVDVRTTHLDVRVRFADVEGWATWSRSHGQRGMWDHVPEAAHSALLDEAAQLLDAVRGEDRVATLNQQVRYTLGHAPAPS